MTVNVVLVREINPPAGDEPVEWILNVTTLFPSISQIYVRKYYSILDSSVDDRGVVPNAEIGLPCGGSAVLEHVAPTAAVRGDLSDRSLWRSTLMVCRMRAEFARTSTAKRSLNRKNGRLYTWRSTSENLPRSRPAWKRWFAWWGSWEDG